MIAPFRRVGDALFFSALRVKFRAYRWCSPPRIGCARSAAFSASSRLFDLNGETNRVRKKHNRAIIAGDVRRFGHVINTDGVLGTHRWRPWSQKNASVAKKSLRMSTCTTAPPAFRKRTWSARNDSSVCCASMSRSPAAMARRVFLSRSTKWRRDDEPLEPQARRSLITDSL
jgi:hypothetical protein